MRGKSLMLSVVALGCGMVASVGISQVILERKGASTGPATVEILVAVKNIAALEQITAERVKLEKWPEDRLPIGAIRDLAAVDGKFANQPLFEGEPLLTAKITERVDRLSVHIPSGYRVFDLGVNDGNGGIGYIGPGDRVDVVGYFDLNGRAESRKVLGNVTVFGVDGLTMRQDRSKATSSSKTIQLLIKDTQLEAMTTASNLGELRLSLRPESDTALVDDTADDGEKFLAWLKTAKPEKADNPITYPTTAPIIASTVEQKPSKQMVIMTPDGPKTYTWSKDGDTPREVTAENTSESQLPPGGVFTGYPGGIPSGFTPVYPGAVPTAPAPPAATEPSSDSAGSGRRNLR